MMELSISRKQSHVLLAVVPPNDHAFPETRMVTTVDEEGYSLERLRVIREVRAIDGKKVRLVSANRGNIQDYRIYCRTERGWVLRLLEATSPDFADPTPPDECWRNVYSSFAAKTGTHNWARCRGGRCFELARR
jgi:hypothetical protein